MEISFPHLAGGFFVAAFVYLILTLQVYWGFPPFYKVASWKFLAGMDAAEERASKLVVRFGFGIVAMATLFAVTELHVFLALAGVICACIGLWLRRDLLRITGGPLPWLMHPLTLPWVVRWPMLVFDLWTLGFALGFALLVLL